jgi:alpha-ribazole phosphatase
MTLWLVRHAQPVLAPGVCYGALDVAANPVATQVAARALALVLPHGLAVQVSPLQRCEQLAQCLRGLRPDLTFKTEPRLREMHFGQWEGVAWGQIPRDAFDAWTANFGDHRFGGEESANEVLARVGAVWDACVAHKAPQGWITHAGVARAVVVLQQGQRRVQRADQWPKDALAFGAWQNFAMDA